MANSMVGANNLHYLAKNRDCNVPILSNISFDVPKGGICLIKGASGSGKSTLLSCVSGLLKPSSGDVYLNGESLYKLNDKERSVLIRDNVGFVFQDFKLIPSMSVLDNICLPSLIKSNLKKDETYSNAEKLMSKLGLSTLANARPQMLSGGEQQRVSILRSILKEPTLLCCDEPTGNLDVSKSEDVKEMLHRLSNQFQVTLLIVSHDNIFNDIASQKLNLVDGRLDPS